MRRASHRRRGFKQGDLRVRNEKAPRMVTLLDSWGGEHARLVLARRGVWIVHHAVGQDQNYTLTHEPTGLAAVKHIGSVRLATKVAIAMSRLPGDWSFTKHTAMTVRQGRDGKAVKKKFG